MKFLPWTNSRTAKNEKRDIGTQLTPALPIAQIARFGGLFGGAGSGSGEVSCMEEAQNIADALLGVIKLMVDEPKAVSMNISSGPLDGAVIHISVSATDVGKVIGKEGRTAKSLRNIVLAMAKKADRRITLQFNQVGYQPKKYPSLYA